MVPSWSCLCLLGVSRPSEYRIDFLILLFSSKLDKKLREKPKHLTHFSSIDKQEMKLLWGREAANTPYISGSKQSQGCWPMSLQFWTPLSSQATLGLSGAFSAWPYSCSSVRESLSASPVPHSCSLECSFLDINECTMDSHTCSHHANCFNTQGSFKCKCKQGYKGNGLRCSGK